MTPSPLHRARMAAIHIAVKHLGMADDAYREILKRLTGHDSARDCTPGQLGLVMDELKAKGAVFTGKPGRARAPAAPVEKAPLLSKIDALLLNASPPLTRAYADGIARKMFRIDRLEFCTPGQLHKVVAALEYARKRREKRA